MERRALRRLTRSDKAIGHEANGIWVRFRSPRLSRCVGGRASSHPPGCGGRARLPHSPRVGAGSRNPGPAPARPHCHHPVTLSRQAAQKGCPIADGPAARAAVCPTPATLDQVWLPSAFPQESAPNAAVFALRRVRSPRWHPRAPCCPLRAAPTGAKVSYAPFGRPAAPESSSVAPGPALLRCQEPAVAAAGGDSSIGKRSKVAVASSLRRIHSSRKEAVVSAHRSAPPATR